MFAGGGFSDPVGGDQGAVEDYVGVAGGESAAEYVGQLRGLGGEDVDAFVEIAVPGGEGDPCIAGQHCQWGVLPEPAQDEDGVLERGRGASSAATTAFEGVDLQQCGEVLGERAWQNR